MKKINKPRTQHKRFPTFHLRLSENDWLIAMFNPNNKQAMYFLAEPVVAEDNKNRPGIARNVRQKAGVVESKASITGYLVSSLERAGESKCGLQGLPRKFRSTEDAEEWLDNQMEDYPGDEFVAAAELQGIDFASSEIDAVARETVFEVNDLLIDADTLTPLEKGERLHSEMEKKLIALGFVERKPARAK